MIKGCLKKICDPRKHTPRKCTCGDREICTLRYYYTNRGGFGIDGGFDECGKIRKEIEELNRVIKPNV